MSSQSKYSPEVQKLIAEEAKRRRQMDITIANLARVPASEITERLNESERARTTYFKPTKRVKLSGFQHHCKKIKLQGGDASTSTQKHVWAGLSEGERKALGDEAENEGIVKAKVDKGKEVTGALNSVASIMKVLDDVYDTKSIFLYGTCDATEEEYKVMTGIYSKGDEIKGFVNEVGGDLKMKLTKAILPDGGSIMSTPNPARSRENARRTALRDRLHQILSDDQLVNQRVLWSKMLRDGERGAGIVARNWPENVPFGNPNTDLSINHIIALEEALESNNPPTFYWQAS